MTDRCEGCRRPKPLQYRQPAFRTYRPQARALLRWLASSEVPEIFGWRQIHARGFDPYIFEFLRQHGFIGTYKRRGSDAGRGEYFLTDQAIRWLDWVGFNWRGRIAA